VRGRPPRTGLPAIKQNPDSLQYIFKEILDLPSERQNDLAALLQKTTLTSIITASKVVADRLTFLSSLELLLFDRESRRLLKERCQLHRILANETWIFGEEFNLSIDDESLSKVLESHLALLGERTDDHLGVTTPDGSVGIVDLMLSRCIPQPKAEQREHLIIELKRPSVKIDLNVLAQVQKYALTVAIDERFRDTTTRGRQRAGSATVDVGAWPRKRPLSGAVAVRQGKYAQQALDRTGALDGCDGPPKPGGTNARHRRSSTGDRVPLLRAEVRRGDRAIHWRHGQMQSCKSAPTPRIQTIVCSPP
jgi:hypothetical protein